MAEILVNILLERLATLALDKVERELNLVVGVKNEVKNLTRSLKAIQAVLEDAEKRQVTEASVRRWLKELEDVSYEMDDVLDKWITQLQKHQWDKQERHNLAFTKKVHASASSFLSGSKFRRLNHRHQVANRIKELNKRLAQIDNDKQRFSFQSTTKGPELPERHQTTAFLPEKTFGRDKEKSLILIKLLSEGSSHETSVPLIIPVIGMGGMGKTTLAQLVYNDKSVESHFEKRIWVCVSDPFEEVKIAQDILEGLDSNSPSRNSNKLQTLMQCISELIEGKKFLLVLDDIWSPTPGQWEELVKPLRNGAAGSRILVTTRKEEVVKLMKANTHLIHLNKLSEELCLSLFFYYADMKESESEVFRAIGKEIVRKCNGLPLAAKTLGSHMCDKKTIQEWQDVSSSKVWKNEEIAESIFKPLFLSYNDLNPIIKCCLLYCVIFPKDYKYDRDKLIELWMSEDYLGEAESLGKKYFDTLIRRFFFQDIEVDVLGGTTCKMHDILHDFLQSLAIKKCFLTHLKPGEPKEGMTMAGSDKVRHLTIMHASQSECIVSSSCCEHLRTLVAFGSPISSLLLASILQLKCLRTLKLSDSGIIDIPIEIGGLIHLRYLDLSKNLLKEIIHLSSLYNLQTLHLVHCEDLGRVYLRGLTNLRNLMIFGSKYVKLIGVDQLTNLRKLDQLNVHSDVQLGVLKNLNQIRLSLSLQNLAQSNPNEAEKANLVSKEHLRQLFLDFGNNEKSDSTDSNRQQQDREIFTPIHPPPGLECVAIFKFVGNTLLTDWFLSLNNLKILIIWDSVNCKHLPPLGKLPSLESLRMYNVGVEKLGVEFLGIEAETATSGFVSFPRLNDLTINYCNRLKEWKEVEEVCEEEDAEKKDFIIIMPCLSELSLSLNQMLPALPDFLWKTPLRILSINRCDRLWELYSESENECAKISNIPNIEIDYEWIRRQDEPQDGDDETY